MNSPQETVVSKPKPRKLPSAVPILFGLVVVMACLLLGVGFIWWYLRGSMDSNTVSLSPQDIASIRDTGQRMAYQANGGVPLNRGGGNGFVAPPAPPDPDGVFANGASQNIRVGLVQVAVKIPPPGASPTLVFRQRNYGMLSDPPTFTIARRIVHEDALAKQLAVTDDQLAKLKPIITQPAMSGKYILSLSVTPADTDAVAKAWLAFNATLGGTDKDARDKARAALLLAARAAGDPAMAKAKADYDQANQLINSILDTRQIEAYKQGKSLAK